MEGLGFARGTSIWCGRGRVVVVAGLGFCCGRLRVRVRASETIGVSERVGEGVGVGDVFAVAGLGSALLSRSFS